MAKEIQYYCVGFFWYGSEPENQLPRFQKDSIWENGFDDKYLDKVKSVQVGSQIAAKTSYTRKKDGKTISVLEVHGIGTVTENQGDGKILKVQWKKDFKPFTIDGRGAYRSTISKVNHAENIELIFGNKKKTENDALAFDEKDMQMEFALNQILFGPPGTGKTYNTINKAVAIVDNLKEGALNVYYENRSDLKERFDELLIDDWENPNGQIGFVTFHQSMSYEDFIEGIKPGLNDEQNVIYDIEPGVFKMMASIARDNWLDANKGTKEQLSFEESFTKFKEEWQEQQEMKFPLKREGSEYTILGFTKSSIKFKKASGGTGHTLSISTLRDYFYKRREIRQTGVGIYYPAILDKLKSYQPSLIVEKEEKNYVLIIDEINRGNVSQIFGELITLIEEDKRLGKGEALEVTLPYSKEKFGVPPNLHIIGTMNTADRSVEALDAALRRRFNFEEMPPKPLLIATEGKLKEQKGILDTVDLQLLLKTINKRIEKLLDKDHQIGHSYFMSVTKLSELKEAFQNKIIPLLQEYFFGDYGKIGLVVGIGFFESVEPVQDNFFADFNDYDSSEFAERTIYKIRDIAKMTEDEFKKSLNYLLKK
ncbi:MAG: AAA family ATPase [Fluviicola sp.]|nr:AAA family ATPase [Fluviicola sp.]MBP6271353.1 AAA family ATPase [Fluviicola sp.]